MEAFGIDPGELAGALQRRFQSSASVARLPGKSETGAHTYSRLVIVHDIYSPHASLTDNS